MKNFLVTSLVALMFSFSNAYAESQQNQHIDISVASDSLNTTDVDHQSYNFGRVLLYSFQHVRYKVTNTGTTALTFKNALISGSSYRATHSCKAGLQPNQVCEFDIEFSPVFEGFQSGRFVLNFNENSQIIIDLWGEGYKF